jgi:hypothetical protein
MSVRAIYIVEGPSVSGMVPTLPGTVFTDLETAVTAIDNRWNNADPEDKLETNRLHIVVAHEPEQEVS